jgi:hypothetical protein
MTYIAIRAMSICGLAYAVKMPKVKKVDPRTVPLIADRRNDEHELVGAAN